MPLSPSEIVAKQIRRAGQSVEDYRKGVLNPKRNAIEGALASASKYQAKMKESLDKKRWEEALRGTPKDSASQKASTVGADRFTAGIEASEDKIQRFQAGFAPLREANVRKVDGMPEDTDAQREARMLENLRGMRAAKGQWRK